MSEPTKPENVPPPGKLPLPVPNLLTMVTESFGLSRSVAFGLLVLTGLMLAGAAYFFIHSAPPGTITITSGPEGSVFYTNACKYAALLKHQGVNLKILTSRGSLDNLERLENRALKVDVGFVQGGITNEADGELVSLGSVAYQPLLIFYRGTNVDTLAGLARGRLAIGPPGSGTRSLALTLLKANGIESGGPTALLDLDSTDAAKGLLAGTLDAVFLMGEDASSAVMRQLLLAPGIRLLNFPQAEAYTRRFSFLSVLKLPQGGIDFGKNIPMHDIYLIGPTVELIARPELHPALSDLLLEAARSVHGNSSLLQHKDEFPAPLKHDIPISDDAARFYKSGTGFFYSHLPFWVASLTSRILVVFVPMIVILIPILRIIPHLYRWRNQSRIYRWYRALLTLERDLLKETDPAKRKTLLKRMDEIEREVNKLRVPAFLADQFYGLRGHITLVREMAAGELPKN